MKTLDRARAEYPIIAAALEKLMRKVALHKRFANAVARRAGLKRGPAEAPPRTIIDAYVGPDDPPFGRQYLTDLSGAKRIKAYSPGAQIYLFRTEEPEALRPGDYSALYDADGYQVLTGSGWQTLAEEDRKPLRLAISTEPYSVGWNASAFDSPVSLSVQVAS